MSDSTPDEHYIQLPLFPVKACTVCGKKYPATAEYFHRKSNTKDGLRHTCKRCHTESAKRYYQSNRERVLTRLRHYRKENPEKESERNRRYRESNRDKFLATMRRWYWKNPEARRRVAREWREANPEKTKEFGRIYYRDNRERLLKRAHLHYRQNRERYAEMARRWRKENPNKVRFYRRRREALERGADGSHTLKEVESLYGQQQGKCFHCGADISNGYHVDHWMPLSRGGSDYIKNIRLLCPPCNLSKNNKLPSEWCPEKYDR